MIAIYLSREITRLLLLFGRYSNRYIERITGCTHQTVGNIRRKLAELGITNWPEVENLTDDELKALLYPNLKNSASEKIKPDLEYVSEQLKLKGKRRKNRKMCHDEYVLMYGKRRTYSYSRFCRLLKRYLASQHVVMKQYYEPGEVLFIDFTGTRVKCIVRGKEKYLNVFVGCLGHSKMLFAMATPDMTSSSWIRGLNQALNYLGGVPEVIQFDNAKAMVIKPSRLALLNDNARAFAQYYGCICDTSRVATPTDNALAKNAAKIMTLKVLVRMNQDMQFFSEKEVNAYLLQAVEKLNRESLQKRPESRYELFEKAEKSVLKPLPIKSFQPFVVQKQVKVPTTYLLPYQEHEYSVPYALVGKEVIVRVTNTDFQVYFNGKNVARHPLKDSVGFTRLT
jgi:transposase